jgi:glyoxylase-like metal-dependent hydrolase (beta-lactamase superfamily II)
MQPSVQAFFDAATSTVTYLVADPSTGMAAIIDPVLDFEPKGGKLSTLSADRVMQAAKTQGLTVAYVLETHAHADHLSAADHIRRKVGAKVGIGEDIVQTQGLFGALFEDDRIAPDGGDFDLLLRDGDTLALGGLTVRVLHTPGHTPGCVTYLVGDDAFVGDTLFMPDYGTARSDFPGGDAATLYRSIRKILALPSDTRLFVGHDYLPEGRSAYRWETTVADQRANNVHIHDGVDEATFVALRRARDATLAPPTLLLPSLQVNIRAGALPDPSPLGRIFLKLPVTLSP